MIRYWYWPNGVERIAAANNRNQPNNRQLNTVNTFSLLSWFFRTAIINNSTRLYNFVEYSEEPTPTPYRTIMVISSPPINTQIIYPRQEYACTTNIFVYIFHNLVFRIQFDNMIIFLQTIWMQIPQRMRKRVVGEMSYQQQSHHNQHNYKSNEIKGPHWTNWLFILH